MSNRHAGDESNGPPPFATEAAYIFSISPETIRKRKIGADLDKAAVWDNIEQLFSFICNILTVG